MTEEMVLEWAEGTLAEWLTGYTSPDPVQFKVVFLGNGRYRVEPTFPAQDEPRTFAVDVTVKEE